MNTFRIISLGCSKNLVDSEYMRGLLKKGGLSESEDPEKADIVLVNTCGFILPAKTEAIETTLGAAELKKSGKIKILIMTGCFSQRYRHELIESMPEVDAFFGVDELAEISEYIFNRILPDIERDIMTPSHYAYLKIAEGCDNTCTYCAIPMIRGPQKSLPIDDILKEAYRLADLGVREILVIAQDTTAYGDDLKENTDLADVLQALDDMNRFTWIRVHYMHPNRVTDKLLHVFRYSKSIMPYVDIPIQHSHSRMLKVMGRGGSEAALRELIKKIHDILPDACIRTTVMTGFPGETEEMFNNLMDFIREIEFDRLGAFAFSMEEDTPAEKLEDDVPEDVKEARREAVMNLQQEISLKKNLALVDTMQTVIIDRVDSENGDSYGRTYRDAPEVDNTVIIPDAVLEIGRLYIISITDALEYDLIGNVVDI